MELLDLKVFCDLIELKSFTEAAKRNYLTQLFGISLSQEE